MSYVQAQVAELLWLYYVLSNLLLVVARYNTFMHDALFLCLWLCLVVMWLRSLSHYVYECTYA